MLNKQTAQRFFVASVITAGLSLSFPAVANADTLSDLYGVPYDRMEVFVGEDASGNSDELSVASELDESSNEIATYATQSISPRSITDEMLYFCAWESGQNYDQGLSWGDNYHAMGYFQFDNRYDLSAFLQAVYNYNPSKYSALAVLGTNYDWDLKGATRADGAFTQLGNDLNNAWHACYNADPTEFAQLQNGWAYDNYYIPAANYMRSRGIPIDNRSDSVKSLCWGMSNLFGLGGWRLFVGGVTSGYDWNGNWNSSRDWPGAGLRADMSDSEFVATLCDYVVDNVSVFFKAQPEYWAGWQNRYRGEKAHYLSVIEQSDAVKRQTLDEMAAANRDAVPDGEYVIRALCSGRSALDIPGGSAERGANAQIWESNGALAQRWRVSHDSDGYITLEHVGTGMVLDVAGARGVSGTNVWQWERIEGNRGQKWIALPSPDGGFNLVSALDRRLALDVEGGFSGNATNVRIWESNGASAQRFGFVPARPAVEASSRGVVEEGAWFSLVPACAPGNALDVEGGSKAAGANVRSWVSNEEMCQLFSFEWHDGYYAIVCAGSGMALEVAGGDPVDGANVRQSAPDASNDAQLFAVRDNGDGTFTFVNKATGLAVDVLGVSPDSGANVDAWSQNGSAAQRFTLVKRQTLDEMAAANRDAVPDGEYVIRALCSGRSALDIPGGSAERGANAQIWESNGALAQRWRVSHDSDGYITLEHVGTGMVLDVAGARGVSGTNVWQWERIEGNRGQKWIALPSPDGGFNLVSALDRRLALDVEGGFSGNATNVRIWESNGASAQRFGFVPARPAVEASSRGVVEEGAWFSLVPACAPGNALDVEGGSKAAGANVRSWVSNEEMCQLFSFEWHDGYYAIVCAGSGMALEVAGGDPVDGANVRQSAPDASNDAQLFAVRDNGDGTFTFVNKATGLAVDVLGVSPDSGANVDAWSQNGSAAQRFTLVKRQLVKNGIYSISLASSSNQVLDISGASVNDGAKLIVWKNLSGFNQKWYI